MALLGMVWTNLMRNKLRTILTWLSVFVALFLFVLLHGITDTLTESTKVGSEQRLVTRNKISLVFPLPMSQYEKIRSLPGVKAATWSNWFGGQDPVDPRNFYAQFAVDGKTADSWYTGYRNPRIIKLTLQAQRETNPAKRRSLYAQIQRIAANDAFMGFLFYSPFRYATASKVNSFFVTPLGNYHLEDVWLS